MWLRSLEDTALRKGNAEEQKRKKTRDNAQERDRQSSWQKEWTKVKIRDGDRWHYPKTNEKAELVIFEKKKELVLNIKKQGDTKNLDWWGKKERYNSFFKYKDMTRGKNKVTGMEKVEKKKGKCTWGRDREKIFKRRKGRPWTSKTKAQVRPKKKIKREAKRRTGWKKGGLEKITTLNRKLNKKRRWKNIARAKRRARAMENEAREEPEGEK